MDNETKQALRCARIGTYLTAALLAVVCIALLFAVPRVTRALDHMETTLTQIDALTEAAVTVAENANALVVDNTEAVSEAMQKFNAVDFDALNRAINDLADVVQPLARVSKLFG